MSSERRVDELAPEISRRAGWEMGSRGGDRVGEEGRKDWEGERGGKVSVSGGVMGFASLGVQIFGDGRVGPARVTGWLGIDGFPFLFHPAGHGLMMCASRGPLRAS